ncbi:MAG TPA: EamA family transporter [Devosia sp.]|nr:EamA family transporter [Devosia sp.]
MNALPPQALLLAAAVFAAGGQVLFKQGSTGLTAFAAALNLPILAGLLLYALGTILWIAGLSRTTLSYAYPFTALTFVLVLLAAIVLFNERPSLTELLGVAIVLGGLGLMTLGHSGQ